MRDEAREIALHFVSKMKLESAKVDWEISRVTARARQLLTKYRKHEIIDVINYSFQRNSSIYSFGYIANYMEEVLAVLESEKSKDVAKAVVAKEIAELASTREEVSFDEQSAERNRAKASRFGVQSRIGEKYPFDLFEGQ